MRPPKRPCWVKPSRENLFGDSDPTGQVVIIKNVPFTVAGVLTPKGQSPTGQDQDDVILLPISTAMQKVLGANKANAKAVGSLMVQAIGPQAMDQAMQEMTALLRERHRILPGLDDDFTVRNLTEVFAAQETSAQVMSILLGAIASVSLIVGGIGIMNIMLVSVTERTREIGLRQAVGAKTRDILLQFLVEAVTLSLLGGIIGIVVGLTASVLISHFAKWSTRVSPLSILWRLCSPPWWSSEPRRTARRCRCGSPPASHVRGKRLQRRLAPARCLSSPPPVRAAGNGSRRP